MCEVFVHTRLFLTFQLPPIMPPSLYRRCSAGYAGCASAYPHPSRTRSPLQRRRPSHDERTATVTVTVTTVYTPAPTYTRDVVPGPSTTLPGNIMSESTPMQTMQSNAPSPSATVRSGIVGGAVSLVGLGIFLAVIWVIRRPGMLRRQTLGLTPSCSSECLTIYGLVHF